MALLAKSRKGNQIKQPCTSEMTSTNWIIISKPMDPERGHHENR
jgi:hypothetical protein